MIYHFIILCSSDKSSGGDFMYICCSFFLFFSSLFFFQVERCSRWVSNNKWILFVFFRVGFFHRLFLDIFVLPTRLRESKAKKIPFFIKLFFSSRHQQIVNFFIRHIFLIVFFLFSSSPRRFFFDFWGFNDKAYMFDVRILENGKIFPCFWSAEKGIFFMMHIYVDDIAAIRGRGRQYRQ